METSSSSTTQELQEVNQPSTVSCEQPSGKPGSPIDNPHAPTLQTYLGISLFGFALSFFWGSMLSLVMPDRVEQIVGSARKDHVLPIILSVGAFVSGVTQIVFGALSDNCTHRLGRRRPFLIFGVLVTSVILLFFPGAKTVGALLGVYVGIQLFLNMAHGPYQALMPDLIPRDHHGRASAFMGVALLLGRIGGPVAAAILLKQGDRGVWLLTWSFIFILNALMIANVFMLKEKRITQKTSLKDTLVGIVRVPLRPYPSFVWLIISRFGIMMGVYTVQVCLFYYIKDTLGFTQEQSYDIIRNFMVLSTITGLIGTLPAGIASDRYSKKSVLFVANAICIAAAIGFALAPTIGPAYVAVAIFGAGFGTFAAVDWALGCGLLPPDEPAKYMGVWSLSDTLSQVVAPLLAGPLAAHFNSQQAGLGYRLVMGLAIIYFTLGTLAIGFIKEKPVGEPTGESVPQSS